MHRSFSAPSTPTPSRLRRRGIPATPPNSTARFSREDDWLFKRSPFRSLLPRLWDVLSVSPPRRQSPFSYNYSNSSIWASKQIDYTQLPPLDGEEGELIDDEACFFCPPVRAVTGIDILSLLPPELSLHILSLLLSPSLPDPHSPAPTILAGIADHAAEVGAALPALLACRSVSRNWARLANDNSVWRAAYVGRWGAPPRLPTSPIYHRPPMVPRNSSILDARMKKLPALPPGEGLVLAAPAPLALDWCKLYSARLELDRRWKGSSDWEPRATALAGHADSVYCLEFSRTHIVTGSRDRSVKVWGLSSGRLLGTFAGRHRGSVLCLKFELSETDVATGGLRGILVTGSSDCTVCVWDMWTDRAGDNVPVHGEVRAVLRGHGGGVLDLRIDERWIVSCSKDAAIRVWARDTLELHRTLRGHEGPVNAVGLQSGDYGADGREAGKGSASHSGRVVSASGDGKMILWDIASGERVRTFEGHDRGLACIEFKGDLIISGSNDCKIKIWSAATGACLRTLVGHEALVRALSFDPRSGRLVSASYDKSVRVWDLGTGRVLRVVRDSHTSHIFDVKFDARRIVSTSHDQKIVVLDFSSGLAVDPALLV
ncbi:WD40 repeat-like protein [Mycena pura]|uniref:WD40 repeat-like protein n=1 Tax=Mycena pura TaxID=153505 RepID=A0AAD6YIQ0_9AGAR|nr:WD40 repeat-like protein [Mycena pura]